MKKEQSRTSAASLKSQQDSLSARYKGLEKASRIAISYGFSRLPEVSVTKEDLAFFKTIKKELHGSVRFNAIHIDEQIAILNAYSRKEFSKITHPHMVFYESNLPASAHSGEKTITLDIIGSHSPLVDIALMHIATTILENESSEQFTLSLNSIGDKESVAKFNRELTTYYKKNNAEASAELKALIKKDPISARVNAENIIDPIQDHAPQTINCLSEASYIHLKEVITYLEKLNLCYTINPKLIPDRTTNCDTVFTIESTNPKKDSPYAVGLRYNTLSKKLAHKKEIPAVRVVITLPKAKIEKIKTPLKKEKEPEFYFVQIGTDAKIKSLQVLEMLRKAKIAVKYALIKDKLVGQLSNAEQMETPYVLIMGQRECLENSVLVRHMEDSAQETVAIPELVSYIKKLKK